MCMSPCPWCNWTEIRLIWPQMIACDGIIPKVCVCVHADECMFVCVWVSACVRVCVEVFWRTTLISERN